MEVNRCPHCMEELGEINGNFCPFCGFNAAQNPQPPEALPRESILHGKYLIGDVLGRGGFGITYIGFDLSLESKVAIKEYYPSGSAMRREGESALYWNSTCASQTNRRGAYDDFLKEARKMARVDSIPSIVRVRETFLENETAYIVMDYVEGETLKTRLKRDGVLTYSACYAMLRPMMEDLQKVHQLGIIHLDISPDNIMIQKDGSVKLLDLGAAKDLNKKSNGMSQLVTKNGFSPAEQYMENGKIGPWTDVYALCATIYYACYGKLVPQALERLDQDTLTFDLPVKETIPQNVIETLKKGLAIRAAERIQSVEELMQQLDVSASKPDPKPQPDAKQGMAKKPKKPNLAVSVLKKVLLGFMILCTAFVLFLFYAAYRGAQITAEENAASSASMAAAESAASLEVSSEAPSESPASSEASSAQTAAQYTAQYRVDEAGGGSLSDGFVSGVDTVFKQFTDPSQVISVTATPAEGYVFVKWSDGITFRSRTDTDFKQDLAVTAIFAQASVQIDGKPDGSRVTVKAALKGDYTNAKNLRWYADGSEVESAAGKTSLTVNNTETADKTIKVYAVVVYNDCKITSNTLTCKLAGKKQAASSSSSSTASASSSQAKPAVQTVTNQSITVSAGEKGTYTGQWADGKPSGQGKMVVENGGVYEGNWENGLRSGQGTFTFANGAKYEGNWKNDVRTGQGKLTYTDGRVYEGNWQNNNRNGQGKLTWANGAVYEGNWANDKQNGQGKCTYSNGDIYEGNWKDAKRSGQGKYTYSDGTIYEGNWKDGERSGQGKIVTAKGNVYEGNWENNKMNGHGKYIWANGTVYEGDFVDGKFNGQGTKTFTDGTTQSGTWKDDEFVG